MKSNQTVSMVAMLLVVVGALAWGLIGFFDYSLVDKLADVFFNGQTAVNAARVVYAAVGLAGVYELVEHFGPKE